MKTVKLKNGSEELDGLVSTIRVSLSALLNEHPISFYELVMCCRDRNHKIFGNAIEPLQALGLVRGTAERPDIHESIRNVVQSAVTGDGLAMTLGDPIADA